MHWTRSCARTSGTRTAGCRAPSNASSVTAASSTASSTTCSTRASVIRPSAGCARLLGSYFDGDASRLAQLLDPTRMGSPLHQFRSEMTQGFEKLNERLSAMEAAFATRGMERARSAAKGTDFENLVEDMLNETVQGTGDAVERTGLVAGDVMRSKKGDFLLTLDPQTCGGAELRVVIEAKDRSLSWRDIREELAEAKRNRIGRRRGRRIQLGARAQRGRAVRRSLRPRPVRGRSGCSGRCDPLRRHQAGTSLRRGFAFGEGDRHRPGARPGGHLWRQGGAGWHQGHEVAAHVNRSRRCRSLDQSSTACATRSWHASRMPRPSCAQAWRRRMPGLLSLG